MQTIVELCALYLILSAVTVLSWGCGRAQTTGSASAPASSGAVTEETTDNDRIDDGTSSWHQPDSVGIGGYEGFCGQTSAANVVSMMTGVSTSPAAVSESCRDLTPGTRAGTLEAYLDEATFEDWSVVSGPSGPSALQDLHAAVHRNSVKALGLAITPTPVHIQLESGGYHWVTVVRVDLAAQEVAFNHWGRQDVVTLDEFETMWGDGAVSGFIAPYTMIRLGDP